MAVDPRLTALLIVGFLGGGHCVGMCGGIVGALSSARGAGGGPAFSLHLAYNTGRIASYAVAGSLAGALGGLGLIFGDLLIARVALLVFANLMLVAMGFYLLGVTRFLVVPEMAGQTLWRRIQPLTRHFIPVRSIRQALPLGAIWGWLPCGLVYSALATAMTMGSPTGGAAAMLAFGLGTLPNLLLVGMVAQRFRDLARRETLRWIAGLLVIGLGCWGIYGALNIVGYGWSM